MARRMSRTCRLCGQTRTHEWRFDSMPDVNWVEKGVSERRYNAPGHANTTVLVWGDTLGRLEGVAALAPI